MYNIKQETLYADQDDIGAHVLYSLNGDCYDYKCQIMREKARVAFFVCFVPYKKTYKKSELETIIMTAVMNNAKRWTPCAPDLYIDSDVNYFIDLCKEYLNAGYRNGIIDFARSKAWCSVFNREIMNPSPQLLFKNIYVANCRKGWKELSDNDFANMIIDYLIERFKNHNNNTVYRNSEYLNIGIMLGEFLPGKENSYNELCDYATRIKDIRPHIIDTIKSKIYILSKQLEYDALISKAPENYYRSTLSDYVRLYKMIVKKKIYY